jgi:hypothetical protein
LGYCDIMKNVTVSVDEETYRRARLRAAERGASVSALVRAFLNGLGGTDSEAERLKREEAALRERIAGFRAADRLGRDELHERGA